MADSLTNIEFNRSKIYEKLSTIPEPENYKGAVPWIIQNQIAATNGVHYIDRIGKLKEYPIYKLPVPHHQNDGLMLDIGCGWGRWLIAGANKGYIPIGLDLRLEFCETSLTVLKDLKKPGYAVVGDLESLPFIDNVFDLVWSFSVIQHTHRIRLMNCLESINHILSPSGFACLEFPNRDGLRNRMGAVESNAKNADNYDSWAVRYYTLAEYTDMLSQYLTHISMKTHSFVGIGVLEEDLMYVSLKNQILCSFSILLTKAAKIIPGMMNYADSVYCMGYKRSEDHTIRSGYEVFRKLHKMNPADNLNIVSLLKCPKYGGDVSLSADRKRVIAEGAGIYYPIVNGVPIMISSEAIISEV